MTRPAFYPYCDNGHIVTVHRNGYPCDRCEATDREEAAAAAAPTRGGSLTEIQLGARPFLLPSEPALTKEHAFWIVQGVWNGEYDAPGLPGRIVDGRSARVLDIGAHLGSFVRWAEARWGELEADCYEPNDAACDILQRNAPGARVHRVAVTTEPAPRLALSPDWGSAKTHGIPPSDGEAVAAIHPRDLPPADLVKIDAEGVEVEVLEHYPHWDGVLVLIYEYHNLEHRQALRVLAAAHGFVNLREQNDGTYGASVWRRPSSKTNDPGVFVWKTFHGRDFMVVDPPSIGFVGHSTVCFDEHEPIHDELLTIQSGDVFVDVGAQFGSYALPALLMGADVIAFEPTEYASECLKASVRRNGWAKIDGCDAPARGRVERVALYDGTPYPAELHAEVFGKHYPSGNHPETTLDQAMAGGRVDWIKIDVEGAELGVLEGARHTLETWHPTLLIEDHDGINPGVGCVVSDYPASIDSAKRIRAMLTDLGYTLRVVPFDVSRKYIVATADRSPIGA